MYSRTKSDSRDDDVTGSGTRPGFMSVTLSVLSQNKIRGHRKRMSWVGKYTVDMTKKAEFKAENNKTSS